MCPKWQNSLQYSDLGFCTAVLYALCACALSLSQKKFPGNSSDCLSNVVLWTSTVMLIFKLLEVVTSIFNSLL